jgi:hypothetical protein
LRIKVNRELKVVETSQLSKTIQGIKVRKLFREGAPKRNK